MLKMNDRANFVCSLCSAGFPTRQGLVQHIHQHLSYRKYECSSCTQLFYTEDERDAHCKKKGHLHAFGMKVSPYCELYVNQFLKDVEYIASHGVDAVVMQRSKANLACDTAISKLPHKGNSVKRKLHVSPDHLQPSSSKENEKEDSSSDTSDTTPPIRENKKLSKAGRQKQSKEARIRNRVPSDDWMRIEVDNSTAISPATQILSEALRTNAPEVQCMLCKTMTPSDYVLRKHHVSGTHMPKDHTESDYVEILSALMQKAYPTMTYNDLQCQIGGCRKEYKCQAARRTHVLRIHFQNELGCPIKLCSFRSSDFSRVNSHLKEDHGLANGYSSLENGAIRDQFSAERAKHNHRLLTLVQMAFPCPIPESCKSGYKPVSEAISSAGVQDLIAQIRDRERKFQSAPPNPLRLRSPSSSSDSDSSETEKASSSGIKEATAENTENRRCETFKVNNSEPKSSSDANAEASNDGNFSESDEEKEMDLKDKPSLPKQTSNLSGNLGKRKKADSLPYLCSPDSDNDAKKSHLSSVSNTSIASVTSKIVNEDEEPASDVDSMSNNASAKSDVGSESGDEVQLIEYVSNTAKQSSAKKPVIDEVVLDDDDNETGEANIPTDSAPSTPHLKRPTYRTLSISGISVRTDIERPSPLQSSNVRAYSERGLSRTLPISGVTIRADSTPVRPYTDIYSRAFSADRGFIHRKSAEASEQQERRRELARRKFDVAKETREVYYAIRRKKKLQKVALTSTKIARTPAKSRKAGKGENQAISKKKRKEESNVSLKKSPSYTVVAVKKEVSTSSSSSARNGNAWKGTMKRFDD